MSFLVGWAGAWRPRLPWAAEDVASDRHPTRTMTAPSAGPTLLSRWCIGLPPEWTVARSGRGSPVPPRDASHDDRRWTAGGWPDEATRGRVEPPVGDAANRHRLRVQERHRAVPRAGKASSHARLVWSVASGRPGSAFYTGRVSCRGGAFVASCYDLGNEPSSD